MNYLKEFNKSRREEHFDTSCLASLTLGHITADKRLRFTSPNLLRKLLLSAIRYRKCLNGKKSENRKSCIK